MRFDFSQKISFVPIANLGLEISMSPDEQKLKEFCLAQGIDIVLVFSMETADSGHIAHTRVFAPKYGYLEDPAAGSGNSAFANFMLKHGLWDGSDSSVEQGGQDLQFHEAGFSRQARCFRRQLNNTDKRFILYLTVRTNATA